MKNNNTLRDRIRKYIRSMHYNLTESQVDEIIQIAMRGGVPSFDEISKEMFVFRFIEQKLANELKVDTKNDVAVSSSNQDPYHPDSLRVLLSPALRTLEDVEATGTVINAKVERLQAEKENPILRDIFYLTYNWMMSYGVGSTFKVSIEPKGAEAGGAKWASFVSQLKTFNGLPALTNEHRDNLRQTLMALPRLARKWAMRILRRDLKIGMGTGNIKRVWPHLLPTFAVSLCSTLERDDTLPTALRAIPGALWLEPKYDGLRSIIVITNAQANEGKVYSRKGLVHNQLQYLVAEACTLLGDRHSGVFDCEAVSSDSTRYSDAVSAQTTHNIKNRPLRLMVFDFLTLEGFAAGVQDTPQRWRRKALEEMFEGLKSGEAPSLRITPGKLVKDDDLDLKVLRAYAKWRAAGYEGVVVKDRNAPYKAGDRNRKHSGYYRIKPFETIDVTIVGFYTGKVDTKYEKILGGFVCKLPDGQEVHVGGGYTDAQRAQFWRDRKKLIGRTMEIAQQERTPGIISRHLFHLRIRELSDK